MMTENVSHHQQLLQNSKESKARTSSNKKAPLPPGRLGLPLLGETLEFLRLTQANRSAEFLNRRVAKYGKVFKTHLLFSPAVSVGAPDGNKFLFANENKLVQNSWPSPVKKLFGPNSLINKTGEQHKHARCIFTSFFGPDGLQRFVPRMDKMVRAHFVQFWEGKDEIMAFAIIKQFAFALAADLFFSITEGPQFRSLARDLFTLSQGIAQPPLDFPGTSYHNAMLSRSRILCTLDTVICQRRKDMEEGKVSSQHDLLSVMISTLDQDKDQLATNEYIKDNILNFLFAGHDTSVSTLAGVLKYLFLNPQCLEQVIKGKNMF
jgi:cytochrome P450